MKYWQFWKVTMQKIENDKQFVCSSNKLQFDKNNISGFKWGRSNDVWNYTLCSLSWVFIWKSFVESKMMGKYCGWKDSSANAYFFPNNLELKNDISSWKQSTSTDRWNAEIAWFLHLIPSYWIVNGNTTLYGMKVAAYGMKWM